MSNIDKSKEVISSIELINDKINFKGEVETNQPVLIDYIPPYGDGNGYTSLELFLLSLSSCLGTSVLTLIRRTGKSVTSLKIDSKGYRKTEHPTSFKMIELKLYIKSLNVENIDVDKAIKLSEDMLCPVWNMIKGNVEVNVNYEVSM
ncbi:MAG: OsmC family protein [Bacteroidales bacterium]|nr:OsmC family protein [Bacteroidales bacterium]MDD4529660.1 OsmC family protein [Bacteroidales bacterium]